MRQSVKPPPTTRMMFVSGEEKRGWEMMEGQENVEMVDDFPEADFLDYRALEGDAMEL